MRISAFPKAFLKPMVVDRTMSVFDWIDMAAAQLAAPLAAVNCLVNPAAILLGGRLPTRLMDLLAERTNAQLQTMAAQLPAVAPVSRAALSEDAPAVGAAILPFSHFLLPTPGALWKPSRGAVTIGADA